MKSAVIIDAVRTTCSSRLEVAMGSQVICEAGGLANAMIVEAL